MTETDLGILCATDWLLVKYRKGSSSTLSVSFSGIGFNEGADQRPEFLATASEGSVNHVLSIIDRKRSWYSTVGLQDQIVTLVRRYIADNGITRVNCIGNSMGGFGALAFADRLGAEFAIALAPQYSMDPDVISDRRWAKFRPFMFPDTMPRLKDEMKGAARYYVFFGTQTPKDLHHMELFAKQALARITVLRGTDHHVGKKLRKLKLLQPIKSAIAEENHAQLDVLLKPYVAADAQLG